MDTQYHVTGTVQVTNRQNGKVDEFYVSLMVNADSEVEAMTIVATNLMRGRDYKRFVWQRLSIKSVEGEGVYSGAEGGEQPLWMMAAKL